MYTAKDFTGWYKASSSGDKDGCVEISFGKPGFVAMRNNSDGDDGPVIVMTDLEFDCFKQGFRDGEFERP